MRIFFMLLLFCMAVFHSEAYALDSPDELLPNPQQEKRAEQIGSQLRCLVCQNESIEDSSAALAKDLRKIVRQHVQAGESNKQIINWMVDRYGNFIRLSPPFTFTTALLWSMPFLALLTGCLAAWTTFRRHKTEKLPVPLTQAEEKRLQDLMKDS